MIVLDTDCLSLLERERILESSKLIKALEAHPDEEIVTTIITYEEQMRGWLAFIRKCRSLSEQVNGYERLHRFLASYRSTPVIGFDHKAATIYRDLKDQKIRVGTMDLMIASIVIANSAVLVTRNLSDFELVPGLRAEDWT